MIKFLPKSSYLRGGLMFAQLCMKSLVVLLAIVIGAQMAFPKDKLQIEIVGTEIFRRTDRNIPATATPSCCLTATYPGFPEQYSAKAILPDGKHAELSCLSSDKDCGTIVPLRPEKVNRDCRKPSSNTILCIISGTDGSSLGSYEADATATKLPSMERSGNASIALAVHGD
jgi:hypothetical protein